MGPDWLALIEKLAVPFLTVLAAVLRVVKKLIGARVWNGSDGLKPSILEHSVRKYLELEALKEKCGENDLLCREIGAREDEIVRKHAKKRYIRLLDNRSINRELSEERKAMPGAREISILYVSIVFAGLVGLLLVNKYQKSSSVVPWLPAMMILLMIVLTLPASLTVKVYWWYLRNQAFTMFLNPLFHDCTRPFSIEDEMDKSIQAFQKMYMDGHLKKKTKWRVAAFAVAVIAFVVMFFGLMLVRFAQHKGIFVIVVLLAYVMGFVAFMVWAFVFLPLYGRQRSKIQDELVKQMAWYDNDCDVNTRADSFLSRMRHRWRTGG